MSRTADLDVGLKAFYGAPNRHPHRHSPGLPSRPAQENYVRRLGAVMESCRRRDFFHHGVITVEPLVLVPDMGGVVPSVQHSLVVDGACDVEGVSMQLNSRC